MMNSTGARRRTMAQLNLRLDRIVQSIRRRQFLWYAAFEVHALPMSMVPSTHT